MTLVFALAIAVPTPSASSYAAGGSGWIRAFLDRARARTQRVKDWSARAGERLRERLTRYRGAATGVEAASESAHLRRGVLQEHRWAVSTRSGTDSAVLRARSVAGPETYARVESQLTRLGLGSRDAGALAPSFFHRVRNQLRENRLRCQQAGSGMNHEIAKKMNSRFMNFAVFGGIGASWAGYGIAGLLNPAEDPVERRNMFLYDMVWAVGMFYVAAKLVRTWGAAGKSGFSGSLSRFFGFDPSLSIKQKAARYFLLGAGIGVFKAQGFDYFFGVDREEIEKELARIAEDPEGREQLVELGMYFDSRLDDEEIESWIEKIESLDPVAFGEPLPTLEDVFREQISTEDLDDPEVFETVLSMMEARAYLEVGGGLMNWTGNLGADQYIHSRGFDALAAWPLVAMNSGVYDLFCVGADRPGLAYLKALILFGTFRLVQDPAYYLSREIGFGH